jgi:hypothetical protein
MNGKPKSSFKVYGLEPEQRAKMDEWLFTDNLSTREVAKRCETEFQAPVSAAGVLRYFRREKLQRELRSAANRIAAQSAKARNEVDAAETQFQGLLASARALAQACAANGEMDAEKRRTFVDCMKLLIWARREGHEALRATTTREKFEFDAATACLTHQIEVEEIVREESVNDGERILAIRRTLFGPDLPEVLPHGVLPDGHQVLPHGQGEDGKTGIPRQARDREREEGKGGA